jgi:hypothetical protein
VEGRELTRRGIQRGDDGRRKNWRHPDRAATPSLGSGIEHGDEGIWITCVRKQEGKAIREVSLLFDEVDGHPPSRLGSQTANNKPVR